MLLIHFTNRLFILVMTSTVFLLLKQSMLILVTRRYKSVSIYFVKYPVILMLISCVVHTSSNCISKLSKVFMVRLILRKKIQLYIWTWNYGIFNTLQLLWTNNDHQQEYDIECSADFSILLTVNIRVKQYLQCVKFL